MVTSAMPQEGKTTTSVNLSVASAHMGARTILVDMDFRRPSVHSRIQMELDGPGIADYLAGNCQLLDCIRPTGHKDLSVIHAGSHEHRGNPARLLVESNRLSRAVEMLKDQFDQVVIDSQPLLSVADSMLLARCADAVVLVVQAGRTPKAVVKQCSLQLSRARVSLAGVVINKVKGAELESSYYPGASYYARDVA
jgi:capsular exopolysaccharide synthesis family protein